MRPFITRRAFVAAGVAAAAYPVFAGAARRLIRAAKTTAQLAPRSAPPTEIWSFGDGAPGPELRYRRSERLAVTLQNDLPQPTTIHWHGLRLPNAMDGVPGLTQPTVRPGETFDYDFDLTDAGTYWYHSHQNGWEQVARGLHGPLIVEESTPPDIDHDLTLVLDDWRLNREAQIAGGFGDLHDWSHAGRIGNLVTVNGDTAYSKGFKRGERVRLRLINAANARIFSVSARGLNGVLAALDGQPLAAPQAIGRLTLTPAQRADLIVDVVAEDEALLISHERGAAYVLAAFPTAGAVSARTAAPTALEPNEVPPLGPLATSRRAQLLMQGGAMGRLAEARLGDETLPIRDLARRGKVWAFNGRADPPEAPLISARLGETVLVEIINDTRWPHAMHLHGHHFRQIRDDGSTGPLRDTLFMAPGRRSTIAFVADNPGAWLLHCHMLEHAAGGMSTWVQVI